MSCCKLNIGLGLVASGKRNIRPGTEYEQYFDTSKLNRKDKVVLYGTNFDTLDKMKDIVRKTLEDTKKISPVLKDGTIEVTCKNIWNFLYKHVQYVKDNPNFEELRRPLRTWADRKGDCDCYSIFISSVLTNMGISHALRMAAYKNDFQHVYVIVPKKEKANLDVRSNYYVIDPVTDRYDYEVSYSKKFDKHMKMPIRYLDGIDDFAHKPAHSLFAESQIHIPFGQEFNNVGVNGLGQLIDDELSIARDFLKRTKLHLENTLKTIKQNPKSVALVIDDPNQFIKEIELVLAAWDNPIERDKTLNYLAEKETGVNGLNGLFSNMWKGVKTGVSKVSSAVSNAAKWTGNKMSTGAKAVASAAKEAGKAIVRYNPLSLAIRGGLQIAFSKNLFYISEKLGYGYYTDTQAKSIGIDLNVLKQYRERLERVKKIWKGLQGKPGVLRSAIMEGHNHGANKRKRPNINRFTIYKNPLNGVLGEPVTMATTGAASGVIATIVAFLKNLDMKDLFNKGKEVAKTAIRSKVDQTIQNKMSRTTTPDYQVKIKPASMQVENNAVVPKSGTDATPLILLGGLGLTAIALMSGGNDNKRIKKTKNKSLSGTSRRAIEMVIC